MSDTKSSDMNEGLVVVVGLTIFTTIVWLCFYFIPVIYNIIQYQYVKGVYYYPIDQNNSGKSLVLAIGDNGAAAEIIIDADGKTMYYQKLSYSYDFHHNDLRLNLKFLGIDQPLFLDYGYNIGSEDSTPNGIEFTCDDNCQLYPLYNNSIYTYSTSISLANKIIQNSNDSIQTISVPKLTSLYSQGSQDQLFTSAIGYVINVNKS